MKYKLVCIDMDGTLLNSKGEVTKENKEALQRAQEKGVHIALTTGRIYQSAKGFNKQIGLNGPIISANGTYIGLPNQAQPFYYKGFTYDEVITFYQCAKKYPVEIHFSTIKGILCDVRVKSTEDYHNTLNNMLPEKERFEIAYVGDFDNAFKVYEGQILKAFCMAEAKEVLKQLKEELLKLDLYEVSSSWDNNIEIMPKGIDKGYGVCKLAELLNISREEVVCIGDNENDLSMIQYAGLGIAMGNSTPEVLAQADDITLTNDESGVAKAIQKYILKLSE